MATERKLSLLTNTALEQRWTRAAREARGPYGPSGIKEE